MHNLREMTRNDLAQTLGRTQQIEICAEIKQVGDLAAEIPSQSPYIAAM
jgi:hypothetical protein